VRRDSIRIMSQNDERSYWWSSGERRDDAPPIEPGTNPTKDIMVLLLLEDETGEDTAVTSRRKRERERVNGSNE